MPVYTEKPPLTMITEAFEEINTVKNFDLKFEEEKQPDELPPIFEESESLEKKETPKSETF
jgi:hypothetical protein